MNFEESDIEGVFEVEIAKHEDSRGFFARAFCQKEFNKNDISFQPVQANIGYSKYKNTLRGLHYQRAPHAEQKFIRCIKGKIYDVVLDLRPASSTYKQWKGTELSAEKNTMLFVPEGCAHGYQTLEDDSEIFYMVSAFYAPEAEYGIRWDDPAFDIEWKEPVSELIISDKDRQWDHFKEKKETDDYC